MLKELKALKVTRLVNILKLSDFDLSSKGEIFTNIVSLKPFYFLPEFPVLRCFLSSSCKFVELWKKLSLYIVLL